MLLNDGYIMMINMMVNLVGGDWNMTFIFPYIGDVIIPIDSYFSEGVGQPPTSRVCSTNRSQELSCSTNRSQSGGGAWRNLRSRRGSHWQRLQCANRTGAGLDSGRTQQESQCFTIK